MTPPDDDVEEVAAAELDGLVPLEAGALLLPGPLEPVTLLEDCTTPEDDDVPAWPGPASLVPSPLPGPLLHAHAVIITIGTTSRRISASAARPGTLLH